MTNAKSPSELRYTLFCGRLTSSFRPSVRSTRQLEIREDPTYFLSLSVRYSVMVTDRAFHLG